MDGGFQDELKICKEELHTERDNTKKLLHEKVLLEQRISRLEKKKAEEVLFEVYLVFVADKGIDSHSCVLLTG